jgi:mannose-6-phosphate isomerase-like protein (cupin superfamily)
MKHEQLSFAKGFRVVFGTDRAQVAEMVIAPGDAEGDPDNRHQRADQWLYVVSGKGEAIVNDERVPLSRGVLLLIEHGDRHEVKNTGSTLLKTLNWYTPRAYTKSGEELPAARRG